MTNNFKTMATALRAASSVATSANDGKSWPEVHAETRVVFDVYVPFQLAPSQSYVVVHLGKLMDDEDVLVIRRSQHSRWEVVFERTTFFPKRRADTKTADKKVGLKNYATREEAEKEASKVADLANDGMAWKQITEETGIAMAVFRPKVLHANQIQDVAFIGRIVGGEEVLIEKNKTNGGWTVVIV